MARYMRTDLGRGHTNLRPPAVVGAGIAWHGPGVYLTAPNFLADRERRRRVDYRLGPPRVVNAAVVQIFFGSDVALARVIDRNTRRASTVALRPPAILASNLPTQVTLAPQRRGLPKSILRKPQVVFEAVELSGPEVTLTVRRQQRGSAHLFSPAVVSTVTETFSGPQTTLAASRRPRVRSTYVYPIVVFGTEAWGYLAIQYVRRPRPSTRSFLRPPSVAEAVVQVYYGPQVELARSRRPQVKSQLRPPAILASNLPTVTTLAPQRRGVAKSALKPPTVVFLAVEIYGPETQLVRIRPVKTIYRLQAPTVLAVERIYFGPEVTLAYSRRGRPIYRLLAPTILASNLPTVTTFAPQRRGIPRYRLQAPVVVYLAVEIYGPEVHLTRIKPAPTISFLKPPTDIADEQDIGHLRTHLTYSRRPVTKSRLIPPTVVGEVVYYGPEVELAPSFRGIPKSRLLPPTVVDTPPAFLPPQRVKLAPSSRGIPKSRLRPPAVVGAGKVNPALRRYLVARKTRLLYRPVRYFLRRPEIFEVEEVFYGPQVTLAPSRRGRPKSFLKQPTILRSAGALQVTLAYSRGGKARYSLKAPTAVRVVAFFGPQITLTYSRRGRAKYLLKAPTVLGIAPFRGILVSLAPSFRGKPKPFRTPHVVGTPPFRPLQVHLTRITPPSVLYLLKPPSVVGAGIAFFGPQVTLVRIRPPKVIHFLRLTLVAFRRPGGDVCGFDIAGSFVCSLELPGSQVSGSSSTEHGVSGSSRAGSNITSSESAGGGVSGSDRKAT